MTTTITTFILTTLTTTTQNPRSLRNLKKKKRSVLWVTCSVVNQRSAKPLHRSLGRLPIPSTPPHEPLDYRYGMDPSFKGLDPDEFIGVDSEGGVSGAVNGKDSGRKDPWGRSKKPY